LKRGFIFCFLQDNAIFSITILIWPPICFADDILHIGFGK